MTAVVICSLILFLTHRILEPILAWLMFIPTLLIWLSLILNTCPLLLFVPGVASGCTIESYHTQHVAHALAIDLAT
jgi:hypothetical protein